MLNEKYYWPLIERTSKKNVIPRYFIPAKYMYANKEGVVAFDNAAKGKTYWLSWDSSLCLKQNREYLSKLLKEYLIIELGGLDGSALNEVYQYGNGLGHTYKYLNVDLGEGLSSLMNKNFSKIDNVHYTLIKKDFDKIEFIKKLKTSEPKAILFLGNTFGNYSLKQGDAWLKRLHKSMGKNDILILGFDKRVASEEHLRCYNVKENGHMTVLAAKYYGLPITNLHACTFLDKLGIHGGVIVTREFTFKKIKFKPNDFIEVFLSLKPTLKNMVTRVNGAGFQILKVLKSNKRHIYHLILKK